MTSLVYFSLLFVVDDCVHPLTIVLLIICALGSMFLLMHHKLFRTEKPPLQCVETRSRQIDSLPEVETYMLATSHHIARHYLPSENFKLVNSLEYSAGRRSDPN